MTDLRVNYTIIQECVNVLQELSSKHPSVPIPVLRGEGECIAELQELANLYHTFYQMVETLAEETSEYLIHVADAFQEADEMCISEQSH